MAFIYDKHEYEKKETIPDLGSWARKEGTYHGLSADKDKLPTYDDLPSGTLAICDDTQEAAFYSATTKKWYWKEES